MKTSQWITTLVAVTAIGASGAALADVGMRDGEDSFRNFSPAKSRAEVRSELDTARTQGLLSRGDADTWADSETRIGPRGPAGSRYSARTRDEVREELMEYRRTHKGNEPGDIYYP